MTQMAPREKQSLDIQEKGAPVNGVPQKSDRRLYCQFLAFGNCRRQDLLVEALRKSVLESVLYQDLNDARGVGLLVLSEDPNFFVEELREFLLKEPFVPLVPKPELTMFGRTYSLGREVDLEDWLLRRPRKSAFNPQWPWAVWYPLRRKPEFPLLPPEEQGKILMEHGMIGMSYGEADYAHDIRLACFGLDKSDNEFVIGLVGPQLYPLSKLVQDMRKTQQTAKYIQSLGPFFVGKAFWQSRFTNDEQRTTNNGL